MVTEAPPAVTEAPVVTQEPVTTEAAPQPTPSAAPEPTPSAAPHTDPVGGAGTDPGGRHHSRWPDCGHDRGHDVRLRAGHHLGPGDRGVDVRDVDVPQRRAGDVSYAGHQWDKHNGDERGQHVDVGD